MTYKVLCTLGAGYLHFIPHDFPWCLRTSGYGFILIPSLSWLFYWGGETEPFQWLLPSHGMHSTEEARVAHSFLPFLWQGKELPFKANFYMKLINDGVFKGMLHLVFLIKYSNGCFKYCVFNCFSILYCLKLLIMTILLFKLIVRHLEYPMGGKIVSQ